MEQIDRTNKCYQTKDDKRHATIFSVGSPDKESKEDFEKRIQTLRENRGKWVWDETTRTLVRAEEYYANKSSANDVDVPSISSWNPEWAVCATGRRMSKGELKRYCRENGKTWENG